MFFLFDVARIVCEGLGVVLNASTIFVLGGMALLSTFDDVLVDCGPITFTNPGSMIDRLGTGWSELGKDCVESVLREVQSSIKT